ncbi:hypothetical protein GGF42_002435 [Coemansia sp. RSA 2424]|nr:hypothetical protein GGF42_002435 [Coemansia sp. RSA 2424]
MSDHVSNAAAGMHLPAIISTGSESVATDNAEQTLTGEQGSNNAEPRAGGFPHDQYTKDCVLCLLICINRRRIEEHRQILAKLDEAIEHGQREIAHHIEEINHYHQLIAHGFAWHNVGYRFRIRCHRLRLRYQGVKVLRLWPKAYHHRQQVDKIERQSRFLSENDRKLRLGEFFIISRLAFEAGLGGVSIVRLKVEDIPERYHVTAEMLEFIQAAFRPNGMVAQREEVLRMLHPSWEGSDEWDDDNWEDVE